MIILGIIASQQSGAFVTPPADSTNWRVIVYHTENFVPATPVQIQKIEWLDAAGDVISVTGASFFASHSDGSNSPDKCFDADDATYWRAQRDFGALYGVNAWLETQFVPSVEVRGIRITAADVSLDYTPREFAVQYKSPGGSWIDLFEVYEQAAWDALETRAFQLGGRVWRLVVNSTTEGSLVAIGELEFRAVENVGESHIDDGGFPLVSSQVLPESRFGAFDADNANPWGTATLPAYIEYWFQTTKPVEQIAVFVVPGREDEYPLTTQLFYSDDFGLSYTEAGSVPIISVSSGYGYGYGYYYGGS